MKIVLAGGGTAGHVTPNIALIDNLRANGFDEIHYIGTSGIEKGLIEAEGIPFHEIPAGKLRRYLDMQNVKDIGRIFKGTVMATKILKELKPDAVFSKGGFASCPVVWAASRLKIPVILHESDITPGLANKLCLPFASKICYAFPETAEHLPEGKAIYTGIPIRDSFFKASREKGLSFLGFDGKKPVLTLIGGSQGSQFLNQTLLRNLEKLTEIFDICHLCGKGNLNHEALNIPGYAQFEYVNKELPDICHATDMFISRAGATTLFEILSLKKPALLIPLSRGSRGDQILNAKSFKKQGFAEMLDEEAITDELFLKTVLEVFSKKDFYAENAKKANLSDCGDKIVKIILKAMEK